MREAAGEVSVFHEIVGEGVELIVEGVLAMRPGFQEMADIAGAAFAAGADQRGRLTRRLDPLDPRVCSGAHRFGSIGPASTNGPP